MLILLLAFSVTAQAQLTTWPPGKTCAAWWTKKTMFLVKNSEAVGVNCHLDVSLVESAASRKILVKIPVAKFDSGEADRDRDVIQMLGGSQHPILEFESAPFDEAQWKALLQRETNSVTGTLKVNGQKYPLKVDVAVHGKNADVFIDGMVDTTFSAFKIKPPVVAGGLVANVRDILYLQFHIRGADITGYKP